MPAGIIGKRVKFPCGAAAVMAEFWFVRCHCGYTWEGKTKAMTPEPEDLPSVPKLPKGQKSWGGRTKRFHDGLESIGSLVFSDLSQAV